MIQFNHLLNLEFALPSILVECVHPVSTEQTQILEKKIISRHYCLFFEDTVMVREAARPRLVSVVALRLRENTGDISQSHRDFGSKSAGEERTRRIFTLQLKKI